LDPGSPTSHLEALRKDPLEGFLGYAEQAGTSSWSSVFTEVELVFFDTTSLYFEGCGGETIGQRGHRESYIEFIRHCMERKVQRAAKQSDALTVQANHRQ
jgi:hypothetical protein